MSALRTASVTTRQRRPPTASAKSSDGVTRGGKPLEPALAFLRELWALDHALGSASKRMHDRMGITAEQRMVLRFLGKFPRMTANELAVMLHVEKSTLSLALKRLERNRLIVRSRDAADARKWRIVLTKQGRQFDRPTVGTVERAVERAIRATSSPALETIRHFLQRLVRFLEEEAGSHARTR